ncbi:hypothetical protein HYX01_00775 [Candidatus Woesearchaeota archaeon]|nr:hypothetical protein [Candidatus Woesearchaeota archaeon]
MKKLILFFLIILLFISLIYSVASVRVFEVAETEKLSLSLKAEDPDKDKLSYTFSKPLNSKGEWQTGYGDAGNYTSSIKVSDGIYETSEEILIVVKRKEEKPVIDYLLPKEELLSFDEGKSLKFKAEAYDLNKDALAYLWLVNGKAVSNFNEFVFEAGYKDAGQYNIKLIVSDSIFNVSKEWNVNVNNVDVEALISQIEDITALETETARLKLPDFVKYGLTYSISEPIGNDNIWKTTYNDAGAYEAKVTAKGKGFNGEKMVKVTIKNNDRQPKLIGLKNLEVNENEEVSISLKAVDDDNDNIEFFGENMPEDSKIENSIFKWKPSYNFVQKNNLPNIIMDKFGALSKNAEIVFVAKSNELSDKKKVKIRVKDVNRLFVLENIPDIEADEGNKIFIAPKYNDPDNDAVSFSYSGFMDANEKTTGFEDAGAYIVKVTATDGLHTETKLVNVKVNDVNRKPVFGKIEDIEVEEGNAHDADNDAISYTAENLPSGAKLNDNIFAWKPNFDVVKGTKKEFLISFIASDGKGNASQRMKITVLNKNQSPKIVDFSNSIFALKNAPILFEVKAIDDDGDNLNYEWDFGFMDKHKGNNQHQRTFTTAGKKKVEVKVSDGIFTVSKVWEVDVV